MKLIEKCLLFGFFCAVLLSMLGFTAQCESIPDKVFRLHVLANSDSAEDQALKLRVRDRILEESAGLMDGVSTREEAEAAAAQSLPKLQAAAEDEIRQAGYEYPVQAEITRMYFPTRQYESVTLPAGEYDALRITIGEAKGKNWWCVLFPALCLPVAEDSAQLSDVLSSGQLDVVQGNYEIRFKAVEWYEQLKDWLENLGGNG